MMVKSPNVFVPDGGEKAYKLAGEIFAEYWQKVTGKKIQVKTCGKTLPKGDIVIIGSDAVNTVSHELIGKDIIAGFKIRYGTDDYHIISAADNNRNILILAGGCGRSTIYAVYDFFRRKAGVEYFWDGDVMSEQETIDISGMDVYKKPRFLYRGLRYFAHRGLHRFQAEHWDFDDWKREIDWILKKRFNLFMLRIGIDDLFQRAFPKSAPYPPEDKKDPDAIDRSYDDRTSFWPLKFRGELRKKVLKYAFDRGLLHPEDTGTMTHWYSRTPSSFLKKRQIHFSDQNTEGYNQPTGQVWDIEREQSWDNYWKLTEAHIKEFGQPQIFHTIGLAERKFGKSDKENLQIKLYVYRKIQQILREHYPDAPLLIASWDFMMYWKNEDVRKFLLELDSEKTIVFDYAADMAGRKTYKDWGLYGKFPWIFGIFHAFAHNTEIRGNYSVLENHLWDANKDNKCCGVVLWPEVSHSDTFLLEYFANNSWSADGLKLEDAIKKYCHSRYSFKIVKTMETIWDDFLKISQLNFWKKQQHKDPAKSFTFEPHNRILQKEMYYNFTRGHIEFLSIEYKKIRNVIKNSSRILQKLSQISQDYYEDTFFYRDIIDITRTIINQVIRSIIIKLMLEINVWRKKGNNKCHIFALCNQAQSLVSILGDIISQSEEFSIYTSMKRLKKTTKINSHTEQTLKSNIENSYCRNQAYELVRFLYQPEFKIYFDWIIDKINSGSKDEWKKPAGFDKLQEELRDKFYSTPLKEMKPNKKKSKETLISSLKQTSELLHHIKW